MVCFVLICCLLTTQRNEMIERINFLKKIRVKFLLLSESARVSRLIPKIMKSQLSLD